MTFDILSAFYQIGLHEESQVLMGDGGETLVVPWASEIAQVL